MSITYIESHGRLEFDKSDRLAKALRLAAITSNEMADHLDVSRTTISNYINGRTQPKRSVLRDWALRTGVPLEWLETGKDSGSTPSNPTSSEFGKIRSDNVHRAPLSHLRFAA